MQYADRQTHDEASLTGNDIPAAVELEDVDCPLGCVRSDEVVIAAARDKLHNLPGTYQVVRCRQCDLLRTNPRPTPKTIGYYYPSDYGPYHTPKPSDRSLLKRISKTLFDPRHTFIPNTKPGRALELGCASGNFLQELRRHGWIADGIEFSAEAANRARGEGFSVHIGQAETAPTPSDPYDYVAGWMVLEHLHDPIKVLQRLHEWTRPGATLALSVPDCGSWEMRTFGQHWHGLHMPNHLYHFERKTLTRLLASAGWRVVQAQNQRDLWIAYASVTTLIHDQTALTDRSRAALKLASAAFLHGRLAGPLSLGMAAIHQTGAMRVIAQRE